MTESALAIEGLSRAFGALEVARDIHFRLLPGERHALIGPNGAGKTTFVDLVTGTLAPDAGVIRLGGVDVTRQPAHRRSRLGLARTFQINQLFRGLSVLDNLLLALAERSGVARSLWRPFGRRRALLDEAAALLTQCGLGESALVPVAELPYGRQRLLELALALAQRPRVLLLDEPAAGVPSAEMRLILDALATLDPATAVLIIEHDMDLVFRYAERITVLVGGAVLASATPEEIAADPQVRAVYLGEVREH